MSESISWGGNAVEYDEMPGSPTLSGTRDAPTGQRKFKIKWTDISTFLKVLFPLPEDYHDSWKFTDALAFPGMTHLKAISYQIAPFDEDAVSGYETTSSDYGKLRAYGTTSSTLTTSGGAVVTVDYGVPPYELIQFNTTGNKVMLEHSESYSAEMLKLGTTGWYWVDDETDIKNEDASVGKLVPQIEHTLIWRYCPSPPRRHISYAIGCVNSDEIEFLNYAPADTLLLAGADIKRTVDPNGKPAYTVTYKILERRLKQIVIDEESFEVGEYTVGWNHFWRNEGSSKMGWYEIAYDDTSFGAGVGPQTHVYLSIPFLNLFQRDKTGDT